MNLLKVCETVAKTLKVCLKILVILFYLRLHLTQSVIYRIEASAFIFALKY